MGSSNASRVSEAHKAKLATLNAASEPAAKKAQKDKNKKVLETASQLKPEEQIKRYAEIKQTHIEVLDSVANEVVSKLSVLHTILEATEVAKDGLAQVHQIEAEANSLSALILAQEEQKLLFAQEIAAKKAEWDAEQREREVVRKRESETYVYNLNVAKRKDLDDWELSKQARLREFEADLEERNEVVTAAEVQVKAALAEVVELREKVATAESRQEAEVKKQVAIATSSLKREMEHAAALERLKAENQGALDKQQIQALQLKIVELAEHNNRLIQKDLESTGRVQAIAERAVEAARPTYFNAPVSNGHDNGNGKRAS